MKFLSVAFAFFVVQGFSQTTGPVPIAPNVSPAPSLTPGIVGGVSPSQPTTTQSPVGGFNSSPVGGFTASPTAGFNQTPVGPLNQNPVGGLSQSPFTISPNPAPVSTNPVFNLTPIAPPLTTNTIPNTTTPGSSPSPF